MGASDFNMPSCIRRLSLRHCKTSKFKLRHHRDLTAFRVIPLWVFEWRHGTDWRPCIITGRLWRRQSGAALQRKRYLQIAAQGYSHIAREGARDLTLQCGFAVWKAQ